MKNNSFNNNFNQKTLRVRHEPPAKRFAVRLDRKIGYLSYEKIRQKTLIYSHVYVPPEFRHKGIAAKLTKTALDYAREKGFSVIPGCSYVEDYVKKHKNYRDILVNPDLKPITENF